MSRNPHDNDHVRKWRDFCEKPHVDQFVSNDHKLIKWSGDLKVKLKKGKKAHFTANMYGFVRLDYFSDGAVWANYFTVDESGTETLNYRIQLYT